jgi:hypothetical protein
MNAMICPYCGKENPDDLVVCGFCGGPLTEITDQPASTAHVQEPALEEVLPPADYTQTMAETNPTPSAPSQTFPTGTSTLTPPRGGIYGSRVWWIVGCLVFVCLILGCIAAALAVYRSVNSSGIFNPAATTPINSNAQQQTQSFTSTSAPAISITPDAIMTNSPTHSSGMLFFDDFSDTSTGWDQAEDADYSTAYYSGSYRIIVKTEMSDSWANPSERIFGDVIVEADAIKNGGPDDNDFGLICRYQDANHFYYATISSDGFYGITRVSSESTEILGRDYLEYSDVINQGFATNRIRFDCVDEEFTLYVNGQMLDQQTDGNYSSGNVGLIAGTFENSGTDILFDNFEVSAP